MIQDRIFFTHRWCIITACRPICHRHDLPAAAKLARAKTCSFPAWIACRGVAPQSKDWSFWGHELSFSGLSCQCLSASGTIYLPPAWALFSRKIRFLKYRVNYSIFQHVTCTQVCTITEAASAPGPQVIPPPGWLPLPHKYSPLIGVW